MTETQAQELTAVLMAAFPQITARLRPEDAVATLRAYASLLGDLDYDVTLGAIRRLQATSKWLPTPAEIRAAVVELQHGATRAGGDAWGDVQRLIKSAGSKRYDHAWRPTFADPIVAACVRDLGWDDLCQSKNPVADRARFIELYGQLAAQQRVDAVTAGIPGATAPRLPSGATAMRELLARLLVEGAAS